MLAAPLQVTGIALVLELGPEAGDAASLVVGVEGQVQADGAPSSPMGLSMPHAKHMRELGCFSTVAPPCALCIMASTRGLAQGDHCSTILHFVLSFCYTVYQILAT